MKTRFNAHLGRHMVPYVIVVNILAISYLVYYFGSRALA